MTTEREMERLVRSWLEPGLTTLTDDVLDAVLDQLPAIPQRRRAWSPRRVGRMGRAAGFALAAIALVAIAIVGLNLAARLGWPDVGNTPTPVPALPTSGCSAVDGPFQTHLGTIGLSGAAPTGWVGLGDAFHIRLENKPCGQAGTARLEISLVAGVYADACQQRSLVSAGTAGAMITALRGQKGHETLEPTQTTLGGYPATRFTYTADDDLTACAFGTLGLWRSPGGNDTSVEGGKVVTVYVVDVGGVPLGVAATRCCQDELPGLDAELDSIVSSLQVEPNGPELPSPSPAESEASLRLPGAGSSPAGVYGWEGGPGMRAGMHKPVDDGITSYETSLTFAIGPNCLSADKSQDAHPVRIAGLDGVAIEPYEPSVTFGSPTEGDVTRAHAFAVADRTLCVFVTWQASTPEDEREAALAVLETILAEPIGDDRIRVRFMLDAGWDTG